MYFHPELFFVMKTFLFILVMSGVLSTDQQSDEFSSMDEQYSCSENEHMTNAGVSGDPYCCDQYTDSTVASLIGLF